MEKNSELPDFEFTEEYDEACKTDSYAEDTDKNEREAPTPIPNDDDNNTAYLKVSGPIIEEFIKKELPEDSSCIIEGVNIPLEKKDHKVAVDPMPPQKSPVSSRRSSGSGGIIVKGVLLLLLFRCCSSQTQDQEYTPNIMVPRYPAQIGDRVDVECHLGRGCNGCHINWSINGEIISTNGPQYIDDFSPELGYGNLVFNATPIHRNSEVRCILMVPSADNTFFRNYTSSPDIIEFRDDVTTPSYDSTTSPSNDATPSDASMVETVVSAHSTSSQSVVHSGTDAGISENSSNGWTTGRIIAVAIPLTLVPIILVFSGVGVLVCVLCYRRFRRTDEENCCVAVVRGREAVGTDPDQTVAQEKDESPQYERGKFPVPHPQIDATIADSPTIHEAATPPRNGPRCSALDRRGLLPPHKSKIEQSTKMAMTQYASKNLQRRPQLPSSDKEGCPTQTSSQQIEMDQPHSENSYIMAFKVSVEVDPTQL